MKYAFKALLGALVAIFTCSSYAAESAIQEPLVRNLQKLLGIQKKAGYGKPTQNSAEIIRTNVKLTQFKDLLRETGLEGLIESRRDITVFAPTNEALNKSNIHSLDSQKKRALLLNLILPMRLPEKLRPEQTVKSEAGALLTIKSNNGDLTINGVKAIEKLRGSNGAVYIIEKLVLPTTK